jgi:putative PIN family toxin of toxin-antitoxin system
MRAVLDANVLVSRFLSPFGNPAQILARFRDEAFDLVVSKAILSEFQEVMGYDRLRRRHRLSDAKVALIVADFAEFALLVEPTERLKIILDDPDDDKLLEAVVAGEAEFIVSGDHHLLELKTYRGIRVVTPAVFETILSQDESIVT